MLFTGLGRSLLGETVPSVWVLVLKTSGTVSPNTDRPKPVNNIYVYLLLVVFKLETDYPPAMGYSVESSRQADNRLIWLHL